MEEAIEGTKVPEKAGYEGGTPQIDPVKERKLVRKLDFHIVPLVMLLYLLSLVFLNSAGHPNH
jgi:hypothetical protein